MNRGEINLNNKKGQMGYSISVLLIFIGFLFFGIFLMQNPTLTGETISDPVLPSCFDGEIMDTWDSIFEIDSTPISIVKNDILVGGKCAEYFANFSEVNMTYILWGYTIEENDENVTYIFAEVLNATGDYFEFLNNITDIANVSDFMPIKNNNFFDIYVNFRGEEMNSSLSHDEFNSTFVMLSEESFVESSYLGNVSYEFSNDLNNESNEMSNLGIIMQNYSYSFFSFTSKAIIPEVCTEGITNGSWSSCINGSQNRTITNKTLIDTVCESTLTLETRDCDFTCTPNWTRGDWSDCIGGLQIRVVGDENSCGTDVGKPALNQTCVGGEVCTPDWSDCEDWEPTKCPKEGTQTRVCGDLNDCGDVDDVQSKTRSCTYESNLSWLFILIVFVVVGVILVVILWAIALARKKETEGDGLAPPTSPQMPPTYPPARPAPVIHPPMRPRIMPKPMPPRQPIPRPVSHAPVQKPITPPTQVPPTKKI